MAKKSENDVVEKIDVIEEEIKIVKKKEEVKIPEHEYPIFSFIEDSINVRKRRGSGEAFKTFFTFKLKGSLHEKKTITEWEKLFKKFMEEPVK